MKTSTVVSGAIAGIFAAFFASAALAQTPTPAPAADEAAIVTLNRELDENWDASQRGQFVYLGYHAAAGVMCDNLTLDPAKVGKVLHESFLASADQLPEAERQKLNTQVIGDLAMATGVFMGLNSHDPAAFCAAVTKERDSLKDTSDLFKN
jgi:hypothetical protein